MIDLESNSLTVFVKWIHGCTDYILEQKWVFIFQINTKVPFIVLLVITFASKYFTFLYQGSSINYVVKKDRPTVHQKTTFDVIDKGVIYQKTSLSKFIS